MKSGIPGMPGMADIILGRIPLQTILQRVPGTMYLTFIPFCILAPIYLPAVYALVFLILHAFFIINNTRTLWGAYNGYIGAKSHSKTNWRKKYLEQTGSLYTHDTRHDLPLDSVRHIVIIPQYKEDLDTMCDTLDVLASHQMALTHYKICLAMEEAEKEGVGKAEFLVEKYQYLFNDITYTVHPFGKVGEIRGKSSNVAWAAKEMVRQCGGPKLEEIITVMDADTCFAQDYFLSLSYYYSIASPAERSVMFFAPTTVFDRNCHNVPFVVRCADMVWSMGVMSNLYPNSPIKFPCSAYSIPMNLAVGVGFWDTDPQSMGEDFHMYLKCFFSTHGKLQVRTIYSPASCCNVQGKTWLGGVVDRYQQSKRHMWGCLDFGYTIRRAIFSMVAPNYDSPNNLVQQVPVMSSHFSLDFNHMASKLFPLIHRVLEAHIVMGQVFFIVMTSSILIPIGDQPMTISSFLWSTLSTRGVHPYVELAVFIGSWIRLISIVQFISAIYFYEKYQHWCGIVRWSQSTLESHTPGSTGVSSLGRRSILQSSRSNWNLLDWAALPFAGLAYLTIPQMHAQILQLFTDSLDYVVAGKPQTPANITLYGVVVATLTDSVHRDVEDKGLGARVDSGFYDFDGNGDEVEGKFSPGMWSEVV